MRRLVHVVAIVLTLLVGAGAAAVIVSQTTWFKNWLRGYVVREANQYLNGTLSIERLGGNLFFGIELQNIGVSMDGTEVVAVKDLGLDYNVFELLTRGLSVDDIRVNQPVIYLRREGDTWSLSRLVRKQASEADRSGPGRPITIGDIGITDGSLVVEGPVGTSGVEVPGRFDHLDARLSFKYEPVRYSIEISQVSFRASDPSIALNALSGGVSVRDDTVFLDKLALRTAETSLSVDGAVQRYLTRPVLNMQVTSDKLSIPEIAHLVPSLAGIRLQPAFELKLDGPLDRLGIDMNVRSSAGAATGRLVADVVGPQSVAGDLSIRHIDLSAILNNPKEKSDIVADAHVDVRAESLSNVNSLRGSVAVRSPRVAMAGYAAGPLAVNAKILGSQVDFSAQTAAYGVTATGAGRVTLPDGREPLAYDIRGRARNLDLRRLPRDLKVPPAATDIAAEYHVRGRGASVESDARIEPSTVAGATIAGGSTVSVKVPERGGSADMAAVAYDADATVSGVDLRRIGEAFQIPALATDRYSTSINGHVTANGRGTSLPEVTLTATGQLTDTSILGGRIPQLSFEGSMAGDTAHAKVNGAFSGFDPAAVSGRPSLKGAVGGTADLDATVAHVSKGVTPDSVSGTARLSLDPSTVGGLEITRASVYGDYRDSTGDIRTLEVAGRDLNVTARGVLALNETGRSNLKVHADSPSLETIGKLVDQPLTGIARLDATVTGNRSELDAAGNLTADDLKYGNNEVLTASSDFTAKVPDLDAQQGSVSATTHATFVSVAGQSINELDARTDYANREVGFDATAKQPARSLSAAGSVRLRPDHQEIHVKSLDLQSQGVRWQMVPGTESAIDYGGDAITVENLRLMNGSQRIAADGTFGRPGDDLKVTLDAIDVATVDALLLRPPQLSGTLNATSTVSGTKEDPRVQAQFAIDRGGFRKFQYESFGGTVDYAAQGVIVDAKLQQSAANWIEARGYAPVSASAAKREYDLHIDSSAIDLGVIQGFTTALTNVKGTAQAKVDVSGTVDDPRPAGVITIQNASFKVEPTGVSYSELDGAIDLQPDKVHIDQIRVLDNQRKALTVTGDLALHEREIGGVAIAIKSSDFKVIDNKDGNVRINSDLRIAGELTAPRIEGDLGVTTGNINADPILAQVGETPYSTEQTQYTAPSETPSSPIDALQVDVHVTVPDDLVVKASDLRAPGAPIGLGALNVTLGGDLWISKTPWDQVRPVGIVKTIRGTYDFQNRRFTILRDGTVRFEGTDELDPALDIRTERVIQAVTARVNVRGTVSKPEIVLSSTPPLEQADIMSLIVFNQPVNQLGEGQQISLAQRAQSMAVGAAADQLAQSIGNALNIDTFEINTSPETGGAAQVAVGQQVGQNLYVKIEQGLGASQTNFILEYELTNWLRFRTNVLQGSSSQAQLFQRQQGSGADLLFFFSY